MKKIKPILCLAVFFSFVVFHQAWADSPKVITLKDGSVIHGELVSFQGGIYTVQSSNLGLLQLSESNVVSVSNEGIQPAVPQQAATGPQIPGGGMGLNSRVTSMQNQIMGNPQTMEIVSQMAQDPEIAAMVSDPAFIQQLTAALSEGNTASVANDPRIQRILANPKMQALIQQVQSSSPGTGQ